MYKGHTGTNCQSWGSSPGSAAQAGLVSSTSQLALEVGAACKARSKPSAFQAEAWGSGGSVEGVSFIPSFRDPHPHSLPLLTFISIVRNFAQVNEVGADGHIIDFVRVPDLHLYALAERGEQVGKDHLLIPQRLVAALLHRSLALTGGREC